MPDGIENATDKLTEYQIELNALQQEIKARKKAELHSSIDKKNYKDMQKRARVLKRKIRRAIRQAERRGLSEQSSLVTNIETDLLSLKNELKVKDEIIAPKTQELTLERQKTDEMAIINQYELIITKEVIAQGLEAKVKYINDKIREYAKEVADGKTTKDLKDWIKEKGYIIKDESRKGLIQAGFAVETLLMFYQFTPEQQKTLQKVIIIEKRKKSKGGSGGSSCRPKNAIGYIDKGICELYKNDLIPKKGAQILMGVKNVANTALMIAGLWKLGKGILGHIFGKKDWQKGMGEGAVLSALRFGLNYVNVGKLFGKGIEKIGSEFDWSSENESDYEELTETAKLSFKVSVNEVFKGIPFSSLISMGVLKFNGNGDIVGMDYDKMKKYIKENPNLSSKQKEEKLTQLNQIILSENGDNGSKLKPFFEEIGLNQDVITNSNNSDKDMTTFLKEYTEDEQPNEEEKIEIGIATWNKQLEGIDQTKKQKLIKNATEMYKDGMVDINFEVDGSDIYVFNEPGGTKVKLEDGRISIKGQSFPNKDILGLNSQKSLLYLAYWTNIALKKCKYADGRFKKSWIRGYTDIIYTNGTQPDWLGMKKNEKYVDKLNDIRDLDIAIEAFAKFLNEVKGVETPEIVDNNTEWFDEEKAQKYFESKGFTVGKLKGPAQKHYHFQHGIYKDDKWIDDVHINYEYGNMQISKKTIDDRIKVLKNKIENNNTNVNDDNTEEQEEIIYNNLKIPIYGKNLSFSEKGKEQEIAGIMKEGNTIEKVEFSMLDDSNKISSFKIGDEAVIFNDKRKVWINKSSMVCAEYIGEIPKDKDQKETFQISVDYKNKKGETKNCKTSKQTITIKSSKESIDDTEAPVVDLESSPKGKTGEKILIADVTDNDGVSGLSIVDDLSGKLTIENGKVYYTNESPFTGEIKLKVKDKAGNESSNMSVSVEVEEDNINNITFEKREGLDLKSGVEFKEVKKGDYNGTWMVELPKTSKFKFTEDNNLPSGQKNLQVVGAFTHNNMPDYGTYINGKNVGYKGKDSQASKFGGFLEIKPNGSIAFESASNIESRTNKTGLNGFRTMRLIINGKVPSSLSGGKRLPRRVLAQTSDDKYIIIDTYESQNVTQLASDLKNKKRGGHKIKNAAIIDSVMGYAENAILYDQNGSKQKPNNSFVDKFDKETNNIITIGN